MLHLLERGFEAKKDLGRHPHSVIVVAEVAGQDLMENTGKDLDASGNVQSANDYPENVCSQIKISINMKIEGSGSNANGDGKKIGAIWKIIPPEMTGTEDKVEVTIEVSESAEVFITDGYNNDGSGQQYNNVWSEAPQATYR